LLFAVIKIETLILINTLPIKKSLVAWLSRNKQSRFSKLLSQTFFNI
jgi:hypothetical protein